MKRSTFIALFVTTHIFFILFQINKHNQIIKLTYQKQKYENQKKELLQKKQELSQQWYQMRKRSEIKKFAKNSLKMGKVKLKQIKKLEDIENVIDG